VIRWAYNRCLAPLVAEQVSLMLIRWREKGNFLNDEQKAKLSRPSDTEEVMTQTANEPST
jgi:hypothetical protein